jgi:HlyD family secretion protein
MMALKLLSAFVIGMLAFDPMVARSQNDIAASAPARIEGASDIMPIGTAASGVIREVLVKEGDHVVKGQVLVQFNCRAVDAEVRQREAEAAAADLSLTRLKSGARDEDVAIAMAQVTISEAKADEAEKSFQRLKALQEGTASRARLQETERDSKMSAAQLLEARERLRLLQAGARGEDIIEAEAKKEAALAAVDQARARLDQCTVRALSNGIILTTHVTPGQFISSATPAPLLRMVDDTVLRVRAEVDERDLQKVCLGQRARVTSDGFKGDALSAKVTQINPGMGRRTIQTGDRADRADRDVRELVLTLDSAEKRWPIGLRVLVFFLKCDNAK